MNRARWMKRVLPRCLVLYALCLWAPLRASAAPGRIVDGWYAHNATLIMLGASDRIVGTVVSPARFAWMYCVVPSLHHAKLFGSMTLNAEAVLALHPDLVFVTRESGVASALDTLGLNAVPVGFTDFAGLLTTIDRTALLLDTQEAKQQASRYRTALTSLIRARPAGQGALKRVLHIATLTPLTVDGDNSIVDEWIRDAGGVNAAIGIHGNKRPVALEQILSWQPDIIVLGADAGDPDRMMDHALWSRLSAVQQNHVFRNPAGVFNWDRYSPELLLQIVWARQLIGTGTVDRTAMIDRITDFYRVFYRSRIDRRGAEAILDAAAPPAGSCPVDSVSGVTDHVGQ